MKVVGQGEAEAHRRADRAGRITGEIEVNLPRKRQSSDPSIDRPDRFRGVEDQVGNRREEGVGERHLLKETNNQKRESPAQSRARFP